MSLDVRMSLDGKAFFWEKRDPTAVCGRVYMYHPSRDGKVHHSVECDRDQQFHVARLLLLHYGDKGRLEFGHGYRAGRVKVTYTVATVGDGEYIFEEEPSP